MTNKPPELPQLFFDARTSSYWLPINRSRFLSLEKRDCIVHLIHESDGDWDPEEYVDNLKCSDRAFLMSRLERAVDYAGPLGGHKAGVFVNSSGKRFLVTSEPNPDVWSKPTGKRDCPFLDAYFSALLGPLQCQWFFVWCKIAAESLRIGDFRPGQMLSFCGPAGSGKSFVHIVITELLGGRAAKPYLFMSGKTNFNEDLAQAESLVIEDESAQTGIVSRREFGSQVKQMTANEFMQIHGKGKTGFIARTFRRLHMSVNDEPENLMIHPPLDESILGKIILFRCADATGALSEDREENQANLRKELPAFRSFLHHYRIPKQMLGDHRFKMRAFHDDTLLELLCEIAPEKRLLDMIDQVIFNKPEDKKTLPDRWTAEELEAKLRNSDFRFAVEKLLYFSSACGTYLARLASKFPHRIEARKIKGRTTWVLREP